MLICLTCQSCEWFSKLLNFVRVLNIDYDYFHFIFFSSHLIMHRCKWIAIVRIYLNHLYCVLQLLMKWISVYQHKSILIQQHHANLFSSEYGWEKLIVMRDEEGDYEKNSLELFDFSMFAKVFFYSSSFSSSFSSSLLIIKSNLMQFKDV